MIVEVMGRYAGWLALASGMAGGGDIILIPEIPYDLNIVCEKIKERNRRGKGFSIIVVGEGAKPVGGEMVVQQKVDTSPDKIRLGGIANVLSKQIENLINMETRVTILGHLLRGGIPTAYDRLLATRFGHEAVKLISRNNFGLMVGLKGQHIEPVPIEEVAGKYRRVPEDSPYIQTAKSIGISFGTE